ncbi:MAG TPA: energy transducer TonB, partial [Flavobacterium sp.]|nr:energy transducer TonB [Flavobacterium sp.]
LDTLVHVTNVKFPKKPELPKTTKPKSTPAENTTPEAVLRNPIISHPNVAIDVAPTNNPPSTPVENGSPTGTGTTPETSGTGTASATVPVVIENGEDIVTAADVMPEYPGGIKKFLTYVGNNFEKPEIDETVVIIMSFVIEKDGSMSNIKVVRNPGYGLDKEAIRVLKAQRTKWKPGIKNGKPIRVLYSLPIRITKG